MDQQSSNLFSEKIPANLQAMAAGRVADCCKDTITQHVKYNPMMVCSECKSLIKVFDDKKAYTNYISFCDSRRRKVLTDFYQDYYVITFKSYD